MDAATYPRDPSCDIMLNDAHIQVEQAPAGMMGSAHGMCNEGALPMPQLRHRDDYRNQSNMGYRR